MIDLKRYTIFLDFNGFNYNGEEKIELTSDEDRLELDSVDIDIINVKADGNPVKFEVKDEKLIVYSKVSKDIEIKFKGKVAENSILGIYAAPYGEGKYMITTQFEAVYARRFIPCFDHPALKARFKLFVRVDKDLKVISNMPIISVKDEGDKVVYEFDETPKMSTYLLYLGIDEFEEIIDESRKPKIIIATVPGKSSKGYFAMSVARRVIDFYEQYFEIPYQLPKVHLIQVPEFAAGAMENWGAITFRESALLADDSSSVYQRFRVAEVVAHELAHQWFGNLVTLKWWDDLWLNESFATFMAYKSLKDIFPQWDSEGAFIFAETLSALEKDSLSTTHPIEARVRDVFEIEQLFDDISYGKGASVLRMVEGFVGFDVFRRGVVNYLKRFSFSNAQGSDFWNSISEVSGSNVSDIMEDWITKPGYPIIYVKIDGKSIEFLQKRFSLIGEYDTIYKVPLTYEVNGKFEKLIFDRRNIKINSDDEIRSIKVNINRSGFYRVLYDSISLALSTKLNRYEELGLVNDYWNFLLALLVNFKTYYDIINIFINTTNPFVTREITSQLLTLYLIDPKKYYKISRDFLVSQYKVYKNLTDDLSKLAYSDVLKTLSYIDEDFALGLSNLFSEYDKLDSNIKEAVAIAYAVATGDFSTLVNKYNSYNLDEEKGKILSAISSIRDKSIVDKVIPLIFNRTIKIQDAPFVISSLLRSPYVRDEACKYIKDNFDQLKQFISTAYGGPWAIGRLIRAMVMCGVDNPNETINFLEKIRFKDISRPINEVEEWIKIYSRVKEFNVE
ncbi:M1 family metallopeptidase [Saccharolobus caldissimus]|uniref:Aminopeptidase n=1 Tax=Saccharolobus caldissimus TaxID=1702097 RepID=A0AAQ4CU43_9CREN|nr:M1 family metallopeptidase [Saccharolobus caldissimus]BDB99324.1 leucyl aminopeptidase [Saccharolobus caldissimus]